MKKDLNPESSLLPISPIFFHLLIPFFQNPPLPFPSKVLFASFEGKR